MNNNIEYHPRIAPNQELIRNKRIILGSFPTWSLTYSNDPLISAQKEMIRNFNGDLQYFYGSSNNRFWHWYKVYIDNEIRYGDIDSIKKSLSAQSIGITDVIFSCRRKNKSALDKHLSIRKYNHSFFQYPAENELLKILCTSKGVKNDMLLNQLFFNHHRDIKLNSLQSLKLQNEIFDSLYVKPELSKPIISVLDVKGGGKIECLAIPSPGSPFRRLIDFGYVGMDNESYLNKYLSLAFQWFSENSE